MTIEMTLDEIQTLARRALMRAGANADNADAVAETVTAAERDFTSSHGGTSSHGLFRIPGYVAGLQSGKVNGNADPKPSHTGGVVIRCDGEGGYAPLALMRCAAPLAECAKQNGAAVLALTNSHHFASLWRETEALAELGVVAMSCVSYMPAVAPFGGTEAIFGTNPFSFAWPRDGKAPLVFDMATAAMAKGEVQIAARDGKQLPPNSGIDKDGNPSQDAAEILKGALLPFGGYKGSALAMMVELLAGALVGESFSFEAAQRDNKDGAPPRGGQMIIALSPQYIAGNGWNEHAESFINKLSAIPGARLPGSRRHKNRKDNSPRRINAELATKIRNLAE
ncbi:MAG: Ldh family oxidoreductase [Gammaproteobacteria bacterium]